MTVSVSYIPIEKFNIDRVISRGTLVMFTIKKTANNANT